MLHLPWQQLPCTARVVQGDRPHALLRLVDVYELLTKARMFGLLDKLLLPRGWLDHARLLGLPLEAYRRLGHRLRPPLIVGNLYGLTALDRLMKLGRLAPFDRPFFLSCAMDPLKYALDMFALGLWKAQKTGLLDLSLADPRHDLLRLARTYLLWLLNLQSESARPAHYLHERLVLWVPTDLPICEWPAVPDTRRMLSKPYQS